MIVFITVILYVFLIFILFIWTAIIHTILFGSKVDPDDNGIIKDKKQKEKYRLQKLKKYNE